MHSFRLLISLALILLLVVLMLTPAGTAAPSAAAGTTPSASASSNATIASLTPTGSVTPNATALATSTITPTATITPSITLTPSMTVTPTTTLTPTTTATSTPSPTSTPAAATFYLPAAHFQPPYNRPDCTPLPHIAAVSLSAETDLVAQLNAFRVTGGQEALVFANGPTQASRRHAADMAFNGVRDFTGSDGSNPGQRLRDTCYEWVTVGQIIGWGFADPGEMAQFWINSPVHRDLLLDSRYDDLGPGYAYNEESDWQHYWSVTLAQPSGPRIRSTAAGVGYSCSIETQSARGGSRLTWTQETPCPT